LITFLAAAANITMLGIGGAFWGLVIGLIAYAILNGRLPQRGRAPQQAILPVSEPATSNGAAS
jgi:benzoate membrane transport protein